MNAPIGNYYLYMLGTSVEWLNNVTNFSYTNIVVEKVLYNEQQAGEGQAKSVKYCAKVNITNENQIINIYSTNIREHGFTIIVSKNELDIA